MPRKHRTTKAVLSKSDLKAKANSSNHAAPSASTSNPIQAPPTSKPSERAVEMNPPHPIPSDRPGHDSTDHTSALSTSDHGPHDDSQDDQDSPSNSDADDPELAGEHGHTHDDEFGDELDHEHGSLHDEDEDDDMDENDMAALRASETLFGFDRASTTARGIGGGSGGALAGLDAMGLSGLRGLGGIMAGFTHRLKNILESLKDRGSGSSTSRLAALQELAEILAVSTEDTLAGYFQTDSFARELVAIIRGERDHNESEDEEDEVALVAALTATGSSSGSFNHPSSGADVEHMLLASRCLANLMEALPGSAHTVVHHGAVPVLCAKLLEINFIDLAEQSLSTLEKISEELPSSIVREGGLTALLQYLDFFSTNVQRTAVTAAANCCSSISSEHFEMVRDVFPILRNVLSYSDQRVSEQAVLAITRVTDSYRHHPDKLQQLLTPDVLSSLTALLSPVGGTKISDNIFSAILKSFTNIGRSSPEVAANLLDAGLADTVYGILIGQTPPEIPDEHDLALELTNNSSVITQALMRKDRTQIQQAIDLVVEVLPPLPKGGIFDPKIPRKVTNTQENTLVKEEELVSTSVSEPVTPLGDTSNVFSISRSTTEEDVKPDISSRALAALTSHASSSQVKESNKEAAIAHRIELLQSPSREHIIRRFNALLLPILLEVYGASVGFTIRLKALVAILKITYFSKAEYLARTLRPVPLASFLASILANRDQNSLVMYALQMVDLLLTKLPDDYHFFFRREGVMHEVNRLVELSPSSSISSIKTRISNVPITGSRSESSPSATMNLPDEDFLQVPSSSLSRPSGSIHPFSTTPTSSTPPSTKDQLIYRARHLKNKYAMTETTASIKAQEILDSIKNVVDELGTVQTVQEVKSVLLKLAGLFSRENEPVTSFELLESGLVEGLLRFVTESRSFGPPLSVRSELLSEIFFSSAQGTPAFAPLVKRLQESLGRLEGFEVLTAVASTPDDSRRSTASMLARQLKICLVAAEGTDVPKNCANVVVSIHAIATFQAFNDYLRPRIIKAQDDERLGRPTGSHTSRLSGMLAAFAAVAGLPASASSSSHLEDSGFSLSTRAEAATESSHSSSFPAAAPERPVNAHAPRRSSRLSGRGLTAEDFNREPADSSSNKPSSSAVLSTSAPTDSMEVDNPRLDQMELDEDRLEGSPIDQEMASRPSNTDEPPVSVQPTQDGSKMEAHTPHGTRIATPLNSRPPSALRKHSSSSLTGLVASGASNRSSKPSYAAAVKAEPKDWHLAFSLGGQSIPLDTTVYGAVFAHDSQYGLQSRNMWSNVYTVTFRKVDGPVPPSNEDASSVDPESREEGLLPASILEGSQQASILRLLRALHGLNLDWHELRHSSDQGPSSLAFAESVFINNKLTAKLNRQLEEPMIVASACLPDWACDLPQQFPFLFPFETRFSFLQSTSFGYARLIQKWVGQARSDSSRRDENLGLLGRLQRQKVRISRQKILESLIKVFELYSSCRAMLEVEYFDEVGTGLGPTLEFFSLASKAFAEKQYQMWRDHESDSHALHVFSRTGLFPAPMDDRTAQSEKGIERLRKFQVLGQFMAKALMDSRIVDISLSRSFARLALNYGLPLTIASVGLVDKALAASLEHLNKYVIAKRAIEAENLLESDARAAIEQIRIDDATVDDLALEFTLPGYDIEIKPDSSGTLVTIDNIEEFIELVIYWTLFKGVTRQIEMFKTGFSMVFPIRDLKSFTPDEIVNIFGNAESEDWSPETLTSAMRADHGYNMDSSAIRGLISIMSSYDVPSRRQFLQFITGAPKLPIGGFRGLHPALTVVRKAAEPGHSPDEYLPSVMTCVNYLKLPEYSSQKVAAEKLSIAMREGADSFHLS